jgi:hypothetical protein
MAAQGKSAALQARFKKVAETLAANEARINAELIAAQGKPVDTGGYYLPDPANTAAAMRPSATLHAALRGGVRWTRPGQPGPVLSWPLPRQPRRGGCHGMGGQFEISAFDTERRQDDRGVGRWIRPEANRHGQDYRPSTPPPGCTCRNPGEGVIAATPVGRTRVMVTRGRPGQRWIRGFGLIARLRHLPLHAAFLVLLSAATRA